VIFSNPVSEGRYTILVCNWTQIYSAFHPPRVGKLSTRLRAGVKASTFTCVGYQVTLCDPYGSQARGEPQRGLRNHYRRALSQPYSVCAEIETPKASRGRKHGKCCPITTRKGVWRSVISSPGGVRGGAPAENGFYAYLRSEVSHIEHPFQYF